LIFYTFKPKSTLGKLHCNTTKCHKRISKTQQSMKDHKLNYVSILKACMINCQWTSKLHQVLFFFIYFSKHAAQSQPLNLKLNISNINGTIYMFKKKKEYIYVQVNSDTIHNLTSWFWSVLNSSQQTYKNH
jgi:hypothetical protein